MSEGLNRREFMQSAAAANLIPLTPTGQLAAGRGRRHPALVSPGCRTSKVKVAKLYLGIPKALWPSPTLDLEEERRKYEEELGRMARDFADVEFVTDQLVTSS